MLQRLIGVWCGIRTHKILILSQARLPVASIRHVFIIVNIIYISVYNNKHCGTCGEIWTHTAYVLSVVPPAVGLHRHIVVIQKRFELLPLQGLSLMHLPVVLLDDGTHGEIRTLKRHRVWVYRIYRFCYAGNLVAPKRFELLFYGWEPHFLTN